MKNIEIIYKKNDNLIKNYIFSITGDINLAEEVMQETFIVAISQINNFRGECKISTWLCAIAKKILYKKLKNNKYIKTISIDEIKIEDETKIEDSFFENDDKIRLYKSIQKLDETTREVMYLRLTGDFSFKEIGEILNKSENWARVTFFRGKNKINKEDLI